MVAHNLCLLRQNLLLNLIKIVHLVFAEREAIKRILIMQLKKFLEFLLRHRVTLQFCDICMAKVDYVHGQRIY